MSSSTKSNADTLSRYTIIDGKRYKLCTGPAHETPEYLPATDKYFHRHKSGKSAGKLVSRCRLCINWHRLKSPGSYHGLVPMAKARPYYIEAVNKIGVSELSRRSGVSESQILNVLYAKPASVQKAILRKIMLELISIRRKNEYSISKGARWRRDRRNNNGLGVHANTKGYVKLHD